MRRSKAILFATALFAGAYATQAEESTTETVKFSEELNKLDLFDWSEEALNKEIAKNPSDVELLKIQLASTYYKSRKNAQGDQIINSIPTSSTYYPVAQRTLGMEALNNGRTDEAVKYLENYRSYVLKKYGSSIPSIEEIDQIEKDFAPLVYIYRDINPNRAKLTDVMKDVAKFRAKFRKNQIDNTPPNQDPPDGPDPENTVLLMYQLILDICEKEKMEGKSIPTGEIQRILKDGKDDGLENMIWRCNTYIRDLCAVQIARCYILMDDPNKALNTLEQYKGNFDEWDIPDVETGELPVPPEESPKAGYFYYKGLANYFLGKKELEKKDIDKAKTYLGAALNNLLTCLRNYKGYQYQENALNLFDDINEKILPPVINKVAFDPMHPILKPYRITDAYSSNARRLYREKKYDEVIPLLLKGYAGKPYCESAPDALRTLADCYLKTNDILFAQVCADLMADRFPKSEMTGDVLRAVGFAALKIANETPVTDKNRQNLIDNSTRLLNRFLALFPTDGSAPDIASTLAQAVFNRAVLYNREAREETNRVKKVGLLDKSKQSFIEAAKLYENVIENFAQKPDFVVRAYLFMGNAYSQAGEYAKSNEALTKFCDKEKDKVDNLASAKMLIADNYFRLADESEKQIKELKTKAATLGEEDAAKIAEEIKELEKVAHDGYLKSAVAYEDFVNNFYPTVLKSSTDAKSLKLLAQAKEYMAWRYDCVNERTKAILAFQEFLKFIETPTLKANKQLHEDAVKRIPPILSRISILYTEMADNNNAAKYLKELNEKYPQSEEAKSALAILGKSMYTIKNYQESCKAFNEMFEKKQGKVPDFYWISNNLIKYEDDPKPVTKEMAEIAVKAGEALIHSLENRPKLSDWFARAEARRLQNNPKELAEKLYITKERTWLGLGKAYLLAGNAKKALEQFTNLVEPPINKTRKGAKYVSPFLYDAYLFRAEALHANNQEVEAHKDLNQLITIAGSVKRYDMQRKAICKMADLYLASKRYKECETNLAPYVMHGNLTERPEIVYPDDASEAERKFITEEAEMQYQTEMQYVEYMCWKYAYAVSKLGDEEKKEAIRKRYREFFKQGRFAKEMNALPAKEADSKP